MSAIKSKVFFPNNSHFIFFDTIFPAKIWNISANGYSTLGVDIHSFMLALSGNVAQSLHRRELNQHYHVHHNPVNELKRKKPNVNEIALLRNVVCITLGSVLATLSHGLF